MANYYSKTRTNTFEVTNEDSFRNACENLRSDGGDELEIITKKNDNNTVSVILACEGSLITVNPDDDDDYNDDITEFYKAVQPLLAENSAMIVTTIGYEKLRYLTAYADIVTSSSIESINLENAVESTVQDMLSDSKWHFRW